MSALEIFIAEFDEFCRNRNVDRIMDLNATGEISGWGCRESDVYPSREILQADAYERNKRIKLGECRQHPVMVIGEKPVTCLLTRFDYTEHHHDGRVYGYSGRSTWFLEWINEAWRIRHGHWSLPLGKSRTAVRLSYQPAKQGQATDRLSGEVLAPFVDFLNQRSEFYKSGNITGLTGQLHPLEDILLWGLCDGEEVRSVDKAEQWFDKLFSSFDISIDYFDPVAFSCGELVCLSAYGELTANGKEGGQAISFRPLRSTFILQQHNEEWLIRHMNNSVPVNI